MANLASDIKPAKTTGSSLVYAALAKPRAPSGKTEGAADEDAVRSENVGRISSKGDTPQVSPSAAETEAGVYAPTIDRAFKANLSRLTLGPSPAVLAGSIPDQEREGERDVPSY
jgi:hypothetical protein